MSEEQIRKIASDEFTKNIMTNLDSSIIFKYIQGLENENQELKKIIKENTILVKDEDESYQECNINPLKMQQENQELKKQVEKYKKVINEAIDMIEKMTESELNYINYKNEKHLICGSDFGEGADIIVSILKEVE